jgi:hypothetical protein
MEKTIGAPPRRFSTSERRILPTISGQQRAEKNAPNSMDMRGSNACTPWQALIPSPDQTGLAKGNADVHNRRSFHP